MKNWRVAGVAMVALLAVAWAWPSSVSHESRGARGASAADLTKPIDQYTGDEFFALVNGLSLGQGWDRQRHCRGNAACSGALRTGVRVDGIAGVDSVSAGNVSQYGVVAARAVVRGNDTEAMYGMQPTGANGRFSYHLIVMPGSTWRLEELNVQGNTRTHRMLATGHLNTCGHPYVPGARADFKTCAAASAQHGSGTTFRAVSFGTLTQPIGDPPLWIGCASGCCTADEAASS